MPLHPTKGGAFGIRLLVRDAGFNEIAALATPTAFNIRQSKIAGQVSRETAGETSNAPDGRQPPDGLDRLLSAWRLSFWKERWKDVGPVRPHKWPPVRFTPIDRVRRQVYGQIASFKVSCMKVITLASRKGGGGKTTIARHLAVEAAVQGFGPVCIVDADPMLGLAQWWSRRANDEPRLLHVLPTTQDVTAANIKRVVGDGALPLPLAKFDTARTAAERAGYRLCIVDTAPATDDGVRLCITAADLVLMPVRPTQDDLDAVGETLRIVKSAGKAGAFVLNGAQKGALSTRAAGNALVHRGELADPTIHRAEAIPATRGTGQVIGETAPGSAAAEEIRQLWHYVAWRLGLAEQPEILADIDTPKKKGVR